MGLGGTTGGLGRREMFGEVGWWGKAGLEGLQCGWGIFAAYIRERHGMYGTGCIGWGFFSNNEISILA